jgi:hypothetical protein
VSKTVTINVSGVDLDVTYTYYPHHSGASERGSGVKLEPDEPAHFEVEEVVFPGSGVSLYALIDDMNGFDTIEAELSSQTDEEESE